jgi:hypothetical protein
MEGMWLNGFNDGIVSLTWSSMRSFLTVKPILETYACCVKMYVRYCKQKWRHISIYSSEIVTCMVSAA